MTTDSVYVKFKGVEGFWISGIPAHNLSREEWEELDEKLQKRALGSGLYELTADKSKGESVKFHDDADTSKTGKNKPDGKE